MDVVSTLHMYYNFVLKENLAAKLKQDGHGATPNMFFIHVFLRLYCVLFGRKMGIYQLYTTYLGEVQPG